MRLGGTTGEINYSYLKFNPDVGAMESNYMLKMAYLL